MLRRMIPVLGVSPLGCSLAYDEAPGLELHFRSLPDPARGNLYRGTRMAALTVLEEAGVNLGEGPIVLTDGRIWGGFTCLRLAGVSEQICQPAKMLSVP